MDKYTGYVVIVYALTAVLLLGYLGWIWWRLQKVREDLPLEEPR